METDRSDRSHARRLAAGALLWFTAVVACAPQEPVGQEPPAAVAQEVGVETTAEPADAGGMDAAPEEPVAAVPEELSLRFVSPNRGPAAGGNEITIDGRGFGAYPRVMFGDEQAWIRSVTPTEIRVTVPPTAGDADIVDVKVTNPPLGFEQPASATLIRSYSYLGAEPSATGSAAVEEPTEAPAPVPPPKVAAAPPAQPPTEAEVPSEPITPESNLIASFSYDLVTDSESCPPESTAIRFTDRSTGGVTEWWWEFGDGETSKEQHNEHCYAAPGMRSVTLTVGNDDGSASASKIVTAGME